MVTTDVSSLVRWYAGQLSVADAVESGGMTVAAPPWLERELARWGRLNPYAGIEPVRSPQRVSWSGNAEDPRRSSVALVQQRTRVKGHAS